MRFRTGYWALLTLFVSACTYDAPLVTDPGLAIDPALTGRWESIPQEPDESLDLLVVTQASATEYAIDNLDGDSVIHFRAFPAELAGVRFVQLEVTGDEHGPAEPGDSDRYSVMNYRLDGEELVVMQLNLELVPDELADTAALQEAFKAHSDAPELFVELGRFRRVGTP